MSDIAKKSFETLAIRVAMQLTSAAGAVVVARTLGPSGKGVYTYAGTMLAVILVATGGHVNAILWQYGTRQQSLRAVTQAMIFVVVGICIPVSLALLLIGALVPSQAVLLVVAAAIPFAVFSQSSAGIFLKRGDVRPINIQQLFPTIIGPLIYAPVLIFVHRSIWVPLIVLAGCYAAAALYTARTLPRDRSRASTVDFRATAREQVAFGSQACLSSLMAFLNYRIDVFLIMYIVGSQGLGVYSVGIGLGELLWQLGSAMINPSLKYISGPDRVRAAEVTAKCMRHAFVLVLAAALLVAMFARWLVPLVYGPSFSYAAVVLWALLPGIVAYSAMPALSAFFSQQLGQPRTPLYFSALSTGVCAIATAAALPHFGIIAGAAATSISYAIAFLAAVRYFARITGMGISRIFALSLDDLRPYRTLLLGYVSGIRGR